METSYNVRIWAIETRERQRRSTYRVAWRTERELFRRTFKNREQAKSFHAKLTAAARGGEAFRVGDGLPVSMARENNDSSWFDFAIQYVDYRWTEVSPGHRRNMVDALTTITVAMIATSRGRPHNATIRKALRIALNPRTREKEQSADLEIAIEWTRRNIRPVSAIGRAEVLQQVVTAISTQLDGTPAAESTKRRKRATLTHALDFAVTSKLLPGNPLHEFKQLGKARSKAVRQIDKRSVVNPIQARTLLKAVKEMGDHGSRLTAFFGCMYHAGLRPEEVANLNKADLSLPEKGWGVLHLSSSMPEIGAEWTDSGQREQQRPLKHRAHGDGRSVPCSPELTAMLHWHVDTHGLAPDGRLFRGRRHGGRVGSSVYGRVWDQARLAALTTETYDSPLASSPYTLRHACVSTWLAAGVPPTKVAEWAGHSVAVLLHVYAKCLDGGDTAARDQIDALMTPQPRRGYGEHMGSTERLQADINEIE